VLDWAATLNELPSAGKRVLCAPNLEDISQQIVVNLRVRYRWASLATGIDESLIAGLHGLAVGARPREERTPPALSPTLRLCPALLYDGGIACWAANRTGFLRP
jgi:hypothetical protein